MWFPESKTILHICLYDEADIYIEIYICFEVTYIFVGRLIVQFGVKVDKTLVCLHTM